MPSNASTHALPLAASLDARSEAERRSRRIAILLMCATMVGYTATDTSAKFLAPHLPLWQIVWVRYLGATLFALCLANPVRRPHMLRPERPVLQLLRSLFLLASTTLSFISIRYLQLADTTAIFFALPLVVALTAGPVLGEWVGPRRLAAILVGFVGVLVVVHPWTGTMHPAMLLCVANVIVSAGYNMLTRIVAQRDRALTTLIYSTLGGAVLLAPVALSQWVMPSSAAVVAVMLLIGIVGALAHWLVILAHARAPASILAPFAYTQLIWAVLGGAIVFGDVPNLSTLAGAAIVILAGLYLWWRERSV